MLLAMVTKLDLQWMPTMTPKERTRPFGDLWQSMNPGTTVICLASIRLMLCFFFPMNASLAMNSHKESEREPFIYCKSCRSGHAGIDGWVNLGVENNQVGMSRNQSLRGRMGDAFALNKLWLARAARSCRLLSTQEFPAVFRTVSCSLLSETGLEARLAAQRCQMSHCETV